MQFVVFYQIEGHISVSLLTSHVSYKTAEGEHHMFQEEGQRTLICFHLFLTREKWRDLTPIIAHLDTRNQKERGGSCFREVALERLRICPKTFYGIKTVKKFYRPAREAVTSSIFITTRVKAFTFSPHQPANTTSSASQEEIFIEPSLLCCRNKPYKPVCLQF